MCVAVALGFDWKNIHTQTRNMVLPNLKYLANLRLPDFLPAWANSLCHVPIISTASGKRLPVFRKRWTGWLPRRRKILQWKWLPCIRLCFVFLFSLAVTACVLLCFASASIHGTSRIIGEACLGARWWLRRYCIIMSYHVYMILYRIQYIYIYMNK